MSAPDIEPPLFRQLLGRFATGVVIITARDGAGHPAGMTANSLASVSLHPPLVSICIELAAEMHQVLSEAPLFAINILGAAQEGLSRRFANHEQVDRFAGVGYRHSPDGVPLLDGVLAYIECEKHAAYPLGDHTLFIGRVTGGATGEGQPLLYYRGGYAGLSAG